MFPFAGAVRFDKAIEKMGGKPAGVCQHCKSTLFDMPYSIHGLFGMQTRNYVRVCFECDHGLDIPRVQEVA